VRQITIDLGEYVEEKKRRERRGGAVVAAVAIIAALVIVALPRTPAPQLAPTPAALIFPTQPVGIPSAAQVVRLRNDGGGSLSISSIASSDDAFRLTHDCTAALAKGDSCNATIVFAPSAPGPRRGELTIATNAGIRKIALIGDARAVTLAAVDLGPLDFGSVAINTPRQPRSLHFVNNSASAVTFGPPAISAPFVLVSDRCREVPPGGSCDVDVALPSDVAGSFPGQLRLIDTRGNVVAFSALSGTTTNAIAPLPTPAKLEATPAELVFRTQPVGTASAAQVIRLRNDGDEPLTIGTINAKGDAFRVSNDCLKPLARNDSCSASVVFAPPAAGKFNGAVTIETNGGTATIALGGEAPATPVIVLPTTEFGPTLVGVPVERVVPLVNRGPATIVIGKSTATAPFEVSSDGCRNAKIAAGGNCAVRVQFRPAASGPASGELLLVGGHGEIVAKGTLRGEGRPIPVIELPPTDFGRAFAGMTVERAVTFTNSAPVTIVVGKATAPPPFEISSDGCRDRKIAPGASCEIRLQFRPAAAGSMKAELQLVSPSGGTIAKGTLRGTGMIKAQPPQVPSIDIKPREINFFGDPGKKTIVVTNIGAIPVSLSVKPETQTRYLIDASQCNGVVLSPKMPCSIVVDGTVAVRLGTSTRIVISYAGRTEFVPVFAKR
jgi:hypothetical protein